MLFKYTSLHISHHMKTITIKFAIKNNNKYVNNTLSTNRMNIYKVNSKGYITYSLDTQYLSKITCHKMNYLSLHTGGIQKCRKRWKTTHRIHLMANRIEATLHHNFVPLIINYKTRVGKNAKPREPLCLDPCKSTSYFRNSGPFLARGRRE